MRTYPAKKTSWLLALAALITLTSSLFVNDDGHRAPSENDFTRSVKEKLNVLYAHAPEERLYLQTDKPFYEPGDDIWFSGYLRDGRSLKASAQSDIVYAELINPKGAVEQKLNLVAVNGKIKGDFQLDEQLPGGLYKIRAYTGWMKNTFYGTSGEFGFEKELQVQDVILPALKMQLEFERKAFGAGDEVVARLEVSTNENKPLANSALRYVASINGVKLTEQSAFTDNDGMTYIKFYLPAGLKSADGLLNVMLDYNGSTESISRSIPIVLNKIDLAFFPEGGDLVCGLESKVAFRALNEFGKPADVEGIVLNEKGNRVASFGSFHAGMGAFLLNPQPGERYHVQITKPAGIREEYSLPQAFTRGYGLSVDNSVAGELSVTVASTETEELSLVAQVRGKVYYTTVLKVLPGTTAFSFPVTDMPPGVCQLTLFDAKGIARAERLSFVNQNRQLNISVETDKKKYLPREKVKMTISVRDERGLPTPANLSMAVVNDQLLSFAGDKSGNILSQMLLLEDLRGKIEDPSFYFNKKESKSAKALDYLLMTAGWRRFTWEKVLESGLPAVNFQAQKAVIAGRVVSGLTGAPLPKARIVCSNGQEMYSDAEGKFSFSKINLSEPVTFSFSAAGFMQQVEVPADYTDNMQVNLFTPDYYSDRRYLKFNAAIPAMAQNMVPERASAVAENHIPLTSGVGKPRSKAPAENGHRAQLLPLQDLKQMGRGAPKNVRIRHGGVVSAHDMAEVPENATAAYYRARQFAVPVYEKNQTPELRTDFRNTIYWNPDIEIGYSGRKTLEFYASDDITSFRATLEGFDAGGLPGRSEEVFYTQLPFSVSAKVPACVVGEDLLSVPVTLANNTSAPIGGLLSVKISGGLKEEAAAQRIQTLMPGKAKTIYLSYRVKDTSGTVDMAIGFSACSLSDGLTSKIKISPRGFPVQTSFSGQEMEKEYVFETNNLVNGSLRAGFTAFPNVVSDLLKGVEGILSEPYGCFEQTSCTAYPNAMVLDYLKHTGSNDSKVMARATDLLDRGYKRLTTFETPDKGYEWFGASPAHEGLTAYGIMEFVDMKRAGQEIDPIMLDRTAQWLLMHRDGKGGFERERHALHDFGRISEDVMNAYIVYALADAGYTDIRKEFNVSFKKATDTKDPYLLAMMANAAYSLGETAKASEAMRLLLSAQQKDGSFNGATHSITYSQGQSLTIETTALSVLAMLKSEDKHPKELSQAVNFLVSVRSGSGVFSSTQGTILALKCLTEYAKFSKRTAEDGRVAIYIDGKKVAEREYHAGDKGAIAVDGLEAFIKKEGKHTLKVKYTGTKNPLPYAVALNWNTFLPASDTACSIGLQTLLSANHASVGETVRLSALIRNRRNAEVPSTVAIIGIPAGLSVQPWQLKELQEKKVIDYYEVGATGIAIYYRGLGAGEEKRINLDLKAELAGTYEAPASSAYLYYTNEFKTWSSIDKVQIN